MSQLIIIRGLPGSGKTKKARELQSHYNCMLIEPDALLVEDGEYRYTHERHAYAMRRCLEMVQVCSLMDADVIFADVLPSMDDVGDVVRAYCVGWVKPDLMVNDMPLLTVDESMARNCHKVRREDIERMAATWQPWPAEVGK